MKKKLSKIAGLTLIEILIAIVISSLMMAAMFTSYTIVNSTYRQVTDRAKISQSGRDLVCLLYTSPSPRDGRISRMPSSA